VAAAGAPAGGSAEHVDRGVSRLHVEVASYAGAAGQASEILVVTKVGRVPYKVPERIPIGLAVGLAGTFITGDTAILERSAFKVVVYPELVPSGSLFDMAAVRIDGAVMAVDRAADHTTAIVREYEQLKPKIIGSAITRLIARAAVSEGARAAGNQSGSVVGVLAALAVEGTLVALDKPDTRSWTSLPGQVYVARAAVPAGAHSVEVTASGPGGREVRTIPVQVPESGFVVVDVTTLR
jgi:hypothetical protein